MYGTAYSRNAGKKNAKDAHLKEKHVESHFNIFDFIAVVCAC